MSSLETIIQLCDSSDTKDRLEGTEFLITYLQNHDLSTEGKLVDDLLDQYDALIRVNNFKVCLSALRGLGLVVDQLGYSIRSHMIPILDALIERLGDSKDAVGREAAAVIRRLMEVVSSDEVMTRLRKSMTHRNVKIRLHIQAMVVWALENIGNDAFGLGVLISPLAQLVIDPNPRVRDSANTTLDEIFKRCGDPVITALNKTSLRPSQVTTITRRFDRLQTVPDDQLLPLRPRRSNSHRPSSRSNPSNQVPQPRRVRSIDGVCGDECEVTAPSPKSSAKSIQSHHRSGSDGSHQRSTGHRQNRQQQRQSRLGATDYLYLDSSIKPTILYTERELDRELSKFKELFKDYSVSWKERINGLKRLQSIVLGGASDLGNFSSFLKQMKICLESQVQDLRSAVVKESCLTICFLSRFLKDAMQNVADHLLPILFKSTYVSVAIIATSADTCIRTILQNTTISKSISAILTQCAPTNTNDALRACVASYLLLLLEVQDTAHLEKYVQQIEDTILNGFSDKSEHVRKCMRQAYWAYRHHWDLRAVRMLSGVDGKQRKIVIEEGQRYTFGSSCSPKYSIVQDESQPSQKGHKKNERKTRRRARPSQRSNSSGSGSSRQSSSSSSSQLSFTTQANSISSNHTPAVAWNEQDLENISESASIDVTSTGTANSAGSLRSQSPDLFVEEHQEDNVLPPTRLHRATTIDYPTLDEGGLVDLASSDQQLPKTHATPAPVEIGLSSAPRRVTKNTSSSSNPNRAQRMGSGNSTSDRVQGNFRDNSYSSSSHRPTSNRLGGPPARVVRNIRPNRSIKSTFQPSESSSASSAIPAGLASPTSEIDTPSANRGLFDIDDLPTVSIQTSGLSRGASPRLSRSSRSHPNSPSGNNNRASSRGSSRSSSRSGSAAPSPTASSSSHTRSNFGATARRRKSISKIGRESKNGGDVGHLRVQELLTLGRSPDWMKRTECFQQLTTILQNPDDPSRIHENSRLLGKLVTLFKEKLKDTHHKVITHALLALTELLLCNTCSQAQLRPHLEGLMPDIFLQLTNAKENIRSQANIILNNLTREFTVDALLPVLLRVVDHRNSKIKLGCLEYLLYLTPSSKPYVEVPKHMKAVLLKCATYATNTKQPKLKKIALLVLQRLHQNCVDEFLSQVIALPLQTGRRLKRALVEVMPDIDNDLAEHRTQNSPSRTTRRRQSRSPSRTSGRSGAAPSSEHLSSPSASFGAPSRSPSRSPSSSTPASNRFDPTDNSSSSSASPTLGASRSNDSSRLNQRRNSKSRIPRLSPNRLPESEHAPETKIVSDNTVGGGRSNNLASPSRARLNTPLSAWGDQKSSSTGSNQFETKRNIYSPERYQDNAYSRSINSDSGKENTDNNITFAQNGVNSKPLSPVVVNNGSMLGNDMPPQGVPNSILDVSNGLDPAYPITEETVAIILQRLSQEPLDTRIVSFAHILWLCENPNSSWNLHFDRVFLALLELLEDDMVNRGMVLQHLSQVLERQSDRFVAYPYAEVLLLSILQIFRADTSNLHRLGETVLATIASIIDPQHVLSTLTSTIASTQHQSAILRAAIRMLSQLVERMDLPTLTANLEATLPCLITCIKNQNAFIRMAVISCFVAVHEVMGEPLFDHLDALNSVHLKLIRIYIRKYQEKQQTVSKTKPGVIEPTNPGIISA